MADFVNTYRVYPTRKVENVRVQAGDTLGAESLADLLFGEGKWDRVELIPPSFWKRLLRELVS
jgi:hypothetical protein